MLLSKWNNSDSTEQIALQKYFTGALKEIEISVDYKFLSTFAPTNKKKKLYAYFSRLIHIQLYQCSVGIVRLVSYDPNTLSIFVKMLKSNT